MRRFLLALAIAMCAVSLAANDPAPSQKGKPVYEQETLHAIPGSFAEMWSQSDIVAKVRVLRSKIQTFPTPSNVPRIRTLHFSSVIKVYKGDVHQGSRLEFSQVAGQLETPDYVVRVTDEEPLSAGEYIVFLKRGPEPVPLFLVGDVDGAYRVNHGYIEPQGRFTAFAREQRGLSERRFADEIEAASHRARDESIRTHATRRTARSRVCSWIRLGMRQLLAHDEIGLEHI